MKPLLFLVGFVMLLYLISSFIGAGKIGLIYTIAWIGEKILYIYTQYTFSQLYNSLFWVYVMVTVLILAISVLSGQSSKQKAKKKK